MLCEGMLKSFLGVSASLASTIYVAAFQPDGLAFLLFVACLPVAIGACAIPFMNVVPYMEASEVEHGHQFLTTGAHRPIYFIRECSGCDLCCMLATVTSAGRAVLRQFGA